MAATTSLTDVVIAEQSIVRGGQVVEMRIFFNDVQSLLEQADR